MATWSWLGKKLTQDPGPALKRLTDVVRKHPVGATVVGGGAIAAGNAYGPAATELESEFMRNRLGAPDAKFVYAQEKVAEQLVSLFVKEATSPASSPTTFNSFWSEGVKGLGKGVGVGLGAAGVLVLTDILRKAGRGLSQKLLYDHKRKDLLREILVSDPIISTFEENNPGMVLRIYASMVTVAPTLSMDRNAVTSFLREAAQTHGAVNYMTIKQLADTEKAILGTTGDERPLGI